MNEPQRLKISVRHLVEFILREGDLLTGGFQQSNRALAGSRGHRRVQKSRPDSYQAEVSVRHLVTDGKLQLEISGRIDGILPTEQPLLLEEIKTTTLSLTQIEKNHNPLHWAQAKCYAYIYALQQDLAHIQIQLTYYQIDTREIKTFQQIFSQDELTHFFTELITPYLKWANTVNDWQTQRDASITHFEFPHPAYRLRQREMAVAVYKTIRDQGTLFAQAPTGIGKTIATLFPAVKAIGTGLLEKIFYLTAKTPGRLVAEKSIADMRAAGLHLKSITLTAKDKICFCTAEGDDPEQCAYTKNYYGKLRVALTDIYQQEALTREAITETARRHHLCPFEFSLDVAVWADCIICDYNYVFDPRVYLRRFFDQSHEPYTFLIDEAHNLPDRAREMFSATLEKQAVLALRKLLKADLPNVARDLAAINQVLLDKRKVVEARGATGLDRQTTLVEQDIPTTLLAALQTFCQKAEAWLALNQPTAFRSALLEFYFQALTYLRTADNFDTNYVSYFVRQSQGGLTAKLFCLDPAPLLTAALARGQAAIFFSATLLPLDYYEQLLTGSTTQPKLILPSPFPDENKRLLIHNRISTKYADRAASYEAIAQVIEAVCSAQTGNYLIFFPSYAYLQAVVDIMIEQFPERRLLVQGRGLDEVARQDFLDQFSTDEKETLLGFAVMGGIFAEGIDLVGERLIGAVVVGVGLPQLGLERDLIKDYFAQYNQQGFAYAYQYPGLNRVMQAAGRVIRSETDRGVLVLIDQRFSHVRYTKLYPPEWRPFQIVQNETAIRQRLLYFWEGKQDEP